MSAPVQVRLFGGVEVAAPGGTTTFGGAKQRALVARLAWDAGRLVPVDALVDGVWGEDAPASVRSSLQVHVSHVRKALEAVGAGGALVTRSGGYVLDLDRAAVDVLRFDGAAAEVERRTASRDATGAASLGAVALATWRGPPFAGTGSPPFAGPLTTRLAAQRVALVCAATDAVVALGRSRELLADAELVAAEHPYDEPLWIAVARLLAAADRQTDALDRLATLRRTLRDELGLDPGPAVGDLEVAILNQQPDLRPAAVRSSAAVTVRSRFPPMRELVGRERLLDELQAVVSAPGVVTLVGPGGVGKTSLAVRTAQLAAPARRHGASFVDLAGLTAGQPVWTAVASSLGLRPTSADEARDEVVALLCERDQIVVLDNCEHVLDDAAALVSEVGDAPSLTVLATSRAPLAAGVERVVEVEPLTTDDLVELFVGRARAASPRFSPDDDDLRAIRELVERANGLALGVELVAPLVRTMTPREILVASAEAAPASRRRDVAERHRSMRDAIDWSVALLDDAGRAMFRRLGVFAAGASLDGARAVCTDDGGTVRGRHAVEVLDDLVACSLVRAERTPSGTRFRMLHPIRVRAEELLREDADELREVSERFIDHVTTTVRRLSDEIETPEPRAAIEELEREAANVRAAYASALDLGDAGRRRRVITAFTPLSLAATTALPEAVGWLRTEYEDLASATTAERIRLVACAAWAADTTRLDAELEPAIAAAEEAGDLWSVVVLRSVQADSVGNQHGSVAGADVAMRAVDVARRLGSPVLLAMAAEWALNQLLRGRQHARADALLDELLAGDTQRLGVMEPFVLFQRGRLELDRHGDAMPWFERSRTAATRVGHAHAVGYALFGIGRALRRTDPEGALAAFRACFEYDRVLAPREIWGTRLNLGTLAARLGRRDELEAQAHAIAAEAHRAVDDAAAALLRACVAHADGDDDAAALAFDAAIGGFARLTLVTGVVEAIELWASAVGGSRGAGMLEVAASLDRGELDVRAAHDLVRAIALGDGDLAEPP